MKVTVPAAWLGGPGSARAVQLLWREGPSPPPFVTAPDALVALR